MNAAMTADRNTDLLDIILSCSVCQVPLSNLNNSSGNTNNSKLWMTECGHLTCATHLSGGGVPFHSTAMPPRAPCPLCSMKKADDTQKALFSVEGPSNTEHDPVIPDEYFKMPPTKLGGVGIESEALRFQYLSLVRFSLATREKVCLLQKELKQLDNHKSLLLRYINAVSFMQQELKASRQHLFDLGQDVSSIDAALDLLDDKAMSVNNSNKFQNNAPLYGALASVIELDTTHIRTSMAQASAADLEELTCMNRPLGGLEHSNAAPGIESMEDSAKKRRRLDPRLHGTAQQVFSYREINPCQAQIREAVSPLTLLEKSPTDIPPNVNVRNDQAIGNRLGIPLGHTLTAQHHKSYNIQTPKVNPNDQQFHGFQYPTASSNKEPQVSRARYNNDEYFALTKQNLTNPQIFEISTIQEPDPYFTAMENIPDSMQNNQDSIKSLMREHTMHLAPDAVEQCLSSPYKGSQYQNRYKTNSTPNFRVGSTAPLYRSSNGLHQLRRPNDGELDNQSLQISAPQPTPGVGISPTRPRITLAPRGPFINCTPRPRTGICANIRSSSTAVTPLPHVNSRLHREQLGTTKSWCLPSRSPYFSRQQTTSAGIRSTIPQIAHPKAHRQIHGILEGPNTLAQPLFPPIDPSPANNLEIQPSLQRGRIHSKAEPRQPPSSARRPRRRAQR